MPDEHSRYGASSMSRWAVCPGSVSLLEKHPVKESPYAKEGTLAHNVAEMKLKARIAGEEVPACADADMNDFTNDYVEYCVKLLEDNSVGHAVEGKFRLDHIEAEHDNVYGTNDFSCWTDDILHIVDFKYGKHRVKAKDNKQLMFYALGAVRGMELDPKLIYLHIYQPRVKSRSKFNYQEISIGELLNFEAELQVAVTRVDKEPEVYKTGSHCYFCNRIKCPEQNREAHKGSPDIEDTVNFKGNK